MLRWLIRLASVASLTVLAYGWGSSIREPTLPAVLLLGMLTVLALWAIVRLFRPGAVASFEPASVRSPPPVAAPREPPPAPPASPPPVRPLPPAPLWSGERPRRHDDEHG